MIYAAVSMTSRITNHGGNNRGNFLLRVNSDGTLGAKQVATGPGFHYVHGWLMWVAWGIFGFVQVVSNRYCKILWKYNMWVHGICGTAILTISLVEGLLAIKQADWKIENKPHNIIGFIVMVLVCLASIGGLFSKW